MPIRSQLLIIIVAAIVLVSMFTVSSAQQPAESNVPLPQLRVQAIEALQAGDSERAKALADQLIAAAPDQPTVAIVSADIYLRTGHAEQAVKWFDRYLERKPRRLPGLWQRGIALYFAGEFEKAARQFEVHREVNPHDVENAAWHFLCVAKADGVDQAKRLLLPAPNDPRPPMQEVLEMLTSGDTAKVVQRIEAFPANSPQRETAEFYGNLYLGLYADAIGNTAEAKLRIEQAAEEAPDHYMGDVARVYAKHLESKPSQ